MEKGKLIIFADEQIKFSLSKALSSKFTFPDELDEATIVIVEECYGEDVEEGAGIKTALKLLYYYRSVKREVPSFFLLCHDRDGKLQDDRKLLQDCLVEIITMDEAVVKLLEYIENGIVAERATAHNGELMNHLQTLAFLPHAPVPSGMTEKPNFIRGWKWNVLVIDNELREGALQQKLSMNSVLGYPEADFFDDVNPVPYSSVYLLSAHHRVDDFLADLRFQIYKNDIDLILLDISLTDPVKRDSIERPKRAVHGFNLLEEIQRQPLAIGWRRIPIVVFSKYLSQTIYVVESISRGAQWFCSKQSKKARNEVGAETHPGQLWVGNLHKILETIHTTGPHYQEYKEKYLSDCTGEKTKERLLKVKTDYFIRQGDFDLIDPFFLHDGSDSLKFIRDACKDKRTGINLQKFWEYHYIFRKLFQSFEDVEIIDRPSAGYSGADLFFVRPYRHTIEHSIQVVKIGPAEQIEEESQIFEERVNGLLDSFIGRIKGKPVPGELYAGLMYVGVGMKEDYKDGNSPVTLKDLISKCFQDKKFCEMDVEWKDILSLIDEIFRKVLRSFYQPATQSKSKKRDLPYRRPISLYLDNLPSLFSAKLSALEAPVAEIFAVERVNKEIPDRIPLKDWEISEVDRIGKRLKVTNRSIYLPHEEALRHPKDRGKAIKYADTLKDIRVDIDVDIEEIDEKYHAMFKDPRLARGKRISLALKDGRWFWDDARMKFLALNSPDDRIHNACKKFLVDKNLFDENEQRYKLYEWFRKGLLDGSMLVPRPVTLSMVHGDLNLDNILITRTRIGYLGWFIDFAKSHVGHSAFDFAKFETEIKTQLLAGSLHQLIGRMILDGSSWNSAVEKCLEWFMLFEKDVSLALSDEGVTRLIPVNTKLWEPIFNNIKRLGELVLKLRHLASEYGLSEEYNWAIFFTSLNALKFRNLDSSGSAPLPKILIYLSGCLAYRKLSITDPFLKEKPRQRKLAANVPDDAKGMRNTLEVACKNPAAKGLLYHFLERLREESAEELKNSEWEQYVEQTAAIANAIGEIGRNPDFPDWEKAIGKKPFDCPSTGGSGSKLPIIVPPLVVAAAIHLGNKDLIIPKMSTRGSVAGTIDILESVGYHADVSLERYMAIIQKIRFSNICQTKDLAPLDDVLMEMRRATGMMRNAKLVVSSILGKKKAVNCSNVLIEIKTGKEGKMVFPGPKGQRDNPELAIKLFKAVGDALKMNVDCILTDGNRPQGRAIGLQIALAEAKWILNGQQKDQLFKLSIQMASQMLEMANIEKEKAESAISHVVNNGSALKIFYDQMREHGVDLDQMGKALERFGGVGAGRERMSDILAAEDGFVRSIDVGIIDDCAKLLVRGNDKDILHYDTGIYIHRQVGEAVQAGDPLATVYFGEHYHLYEAEAMIREAFLIAEWDSGEEHSYLDISGSLGPNQSL